jgi:hypothetical protein
MSDTVLAALIGAVTSIIVALIGKQTAHGRRLESRPVPGRQLPTPAWSVTLAVLALWLLISPGAIHHDFAGSNFFVIPIVLLILAFVRPIRPLTAGWVSLAIFSANFVLGPLGNRLAGSAHDIAFGLEFEKVRLILVIGFVAAGLVSGLCAVRLRQPHPLEESAKQTTHQEDATPESTFTTELERLAALHSEGKLSDDEFRAAKKRILGGS